jgi:hypothetical protein
MTSTTTRIITTVLAILALAAPVASAMPMRDGSPQIRTGSLAGTTSTPKQDLRNADNRAARPEDSKANVYVVPYQQPQTMKPVPPPKAAPVATTDTDDGTSPLVYILPGLVLIAMLAAGFSFARMSRRPAQV